MDGNIAVFGSTGLTGSEVVYQALDRGCRVTAFCRDPSKLKVGSHALVLTHDVIVKSPVPSLFRKRTG